MARLSMLSACIFVSASMALANAPPDDRIREVPIYVTVEAAVPPGATPTAGAPDRVSTAPGIPVKIRGLVERHLVRTKVTVTVTPPKTAEDKVDPEADSGCVEEEAPSRERGGGTLKPVPPTKLSAAVDASAAFEVVFTPQTVGEHEVVVTDVTGRYKGETSFEVVKPELQARCGEKIAEDVRREGQELVDNLHKLVDVLCGRLNELPGSPAKDEAKKKCTALDKALDAQLAARKPPIWAHASDHLVQLRKQGPELRAATLPLLANMNEWVRQTTAANDKFSTALAALTRGNVVCDQLDVIINGLKFCDFFLSLATTPARFFVDWGKENIPTKLIALLPTARRTPARLQAIESGWKGVMTFSPTREKIAGGDVRAFIDVQDTSNFSRGYEFGRGVQTMSADLSQFVASRFFDKYCKQFQGTFAGGMKAEFYYQHRTWWKFSVDIEGQLTLRYPSDARGETLPLTGEFTGNATRFSSWDDAIRMRHASLSKGAIFKSFRHEPLTFNDLMKAAEGPLGGRAQVGGRTAPDFVVGSVLDKGGPVVRSMTTPAFFRVPVRGELRGDTLRLEIQDAALDYDERVRVVTIMLSVLSMRPHIVEYSLPYKDGRWILSRATGAIDGASVEFPVKRVGETLIIERQFKSERPGDENKGNYQLTIKACNPGC